MIPKIIHYCWFGKHKMPAGDLKHIQEWRNKCPDFKIIKWSEKNFNCQEHLFTKRAYRLHNWAAISDYVRLSVLKRMGGVYLDTDVKMIKPIRPLLHQPAFIGLENPRAIASGLIFGASPMDKNVIEMLQVYDYLAKSDAFYRCLNDQVYITTAHFLKYGFKYVNKKQLVSNCYIYPTDYFCPKRLDHRLKINLDSNTYTVHEYDDSWSRNPNDQRQATFDHEAEKKIKYYLKVMDKIGGSRYL